MWLGWGPRIGSFPTRGERSASCSTFMHSMHNRMWLLTLTGYSFCAGWECPDKPLALVRLWTR